MGHTAPMNIFLKQEIDRIQVVIKLVRVTLKDLLLAIEGVIIMSEVIILQSGSQEYVCAIVKPVVSYEGNKIHKYT